MVASITMRQLYYNPSLLNFFFREQAQRELENVIKAFDSTLDALDAIEEHFEDLDEFEEVCYSEDLPDILEMLA